MATRIVLCWYYVWQHTYNADLTKVEISFNFPVYIAFTLQLKMTFFGWIFSGQGFDPMNQASKGPAPPLEMKNEDRYVLMGFPDDKQCGNIIVRGQYSTLLD